MKIILIALSFSGIVWTASAVDSPQPPTTTEGKLDPMAQASAVSEAGKSPSKVMTVAEFETLLSAPKSSSASKVITRGEAMRKMFELAQ